MPRNTKDLENSKKEELEKKVESKKSAPKATTKSAPKTEKKVENKPTSKMAAAKKSTSAEKNKSTVSSKADTKSTSTTKKPTSNKVETKKSTNNKEVKKVDDKTTVKVETKKSTSTTAKKVEPKKSTTDSVKTEVKKVDSTSAKKVAVKKSTSTPKSKVATNAAAKKSTSSKTTVAKTSTTKKSTSKVTPISDKVAKSETTKKSPVTKKASPKTTVEVEEKTSKSKIASLADSLFNKIKQFIAGSQKEEDSKKPNRKAKKTLVNQDLTIAGLPEYYDLPYKYNDTIVKILAQTPKRLFVYWDISDKDRKTYIKAFGDDFFDKTYPVLLVHNIDKNYTFEVPVNDFANSWYLDINDSKCQYSIELGRKFKAPVELMEDSLEIIRENNIDLRNDYIYITTSNVLEAPNDHILFENLPAQITFRNVKTMEEYTVNTKDYINDSSIDNLYNIEDLYKALYKEDNSDDIYDLSNPSSANPTSTFK